MNDARKGMGSGYHKLFAASTISNLGDGIGQIAYPWLASATTRDPLLIALVGVGQRLPWLLFSLPAGVITDRYERRKLMVAANVARAVITFIVAAVVLREAGALPGPDELNDVSLMIDTRIGLYSMMLAATLLLGTAEVLYDNTAQTIMPSLVQPALLEKANGRLWSAEQVMNTVGGPALGAALLAISFAVPFVVDALTFALSAVLIYLLPRPTRAPKPRADRLPWKQELGDGFRWLWRHPLLRPLAISLGLLNLLGTLSFAAFVLFAQEVLGTSTIEFAILTTGGAAGGIVGGWSASWISRRLGPGRSLSVVLITGGISTAVIGATSLWPVVWLMFSVSMFFGVLWNVITVSLRQEIIPDELLGRVNSVYRFFGWGMMPIGALLGGGIIVIAEAIGTREFALRLPWFVAGVLQIVLLAYTAPRLTTTRISEARAAAKTSEAAATLDR